MKDIGRVGQIVAFNQMLVLGCIASFALPALADSDPNACRGVDFDMKRPLVASRNSVRPHVNFVKGPDDDAACPADKDACRKKRTSCNTDRTGTGRLHLCFVSIVSCTKTELDGRLAPDLIPNSTGTDGLAQGGRLDRHVVSSRWHDLNQAW
jgi:hypothetical protein